MYMYFHFQYLWGGAFGIPNPSLAAKDAICMPKNATQTIMQAIKGEVEYNSETYNESVILARMKTKAYAYVYVLSKHNYFTSPITSFSPTHQLKSTPFSPTHILKGEKINWHYTYNIYEDFIFF